MVNIYINDKITGKLKKIDNPVKGSWIDMVKPTPKEIEIISKQIGIDEKTIKYSLDISEKAHIDTIDENVLIIVDSPSIESTSNQKIYTTIPIGMILVRDDFFITVSQAKVDAVSTIISENKVLETNKKSKFVFEILFRIAKDYIKYLTYINKDLENFETKMKTTMSNDELLKLLNFQKTMIYFNASVKANQVVLEKLNRGKTIKLYEEDQEVLEDTIIENKQAIEMIVTYSEILNGIIEIFGTMVSNNLNNVMKILTSLTIIISIPTLISSFLGMNVDFPFATNTIGFYGVIVISCIATIVCTMILNKKRLL